jgi:S-adenosylmethionine:tRNA-ribosyltransferase-isomerase (queuine synthetase)
MTVIHQPRLDTILMVERAILKSKNYPSRTSLWRSLPRKIQYQTFKHILDYLEASGKIIFNDTKIVYTGANNAKLRALIKSSVRVA